MQPMLAPETTDVVLLCGGKGSRLAPLTQSLPKPLLSVGERPFLFYLLQSLRRQGFRRFILATHHLSEKFTDFLATYREFAPQSIVVFEEKPLGTGGALRHAATFALSPVFVALNGDSFISQPLGPVLSSHGRAGNAFTMVAVRAENVIGGVENKGALDIGAAGEIQGLSSGAGTRQWVNAGVYVIDRDLASAWPSGSYDLERNLKDLLGQKKGCVFFSPGRLLDIGTPECYAEAKRMPDFFVAEAIP
ncbi:MAG: NTP transferase domain-containing protein [Deltaproteobacteria bacterium]|nr:NTP transferase domain-containing protein [Deltaproteobacteria bacterium]